MSPKKQPGLCPKCGLMNLPSENRCRSCDTPLSGFAAMTGGKGARLTLLIAGAGVAIAILAVTILIYLTASN
jgi:hypothetical protein